MIAVVINGETMNLNHKISVHNLDMVTTTTYVSKLNHNCFISTSIFADENTFENVVCNLVAISSRS